MMMTKPDFLATKRYAVVTGGNKGIGFEICKQLASKGVVVILTARDEKRGVEAVEKLRACSGLTPDDQVVFHQLDVVDSSSVTKLADFIKSKFGKLDILVNNAGIAGASGDTDTVKKVLENGWPGKDFNWKSLVSETYDMAEQCIQTNYHGSKKMIVELLPLLQLSDSPRIVNVSSSLGKLQLIPGNEKKAVLSDIDILTEKKLDELVNEFLEDFKAGSVETKGWPAEQSAYKVSKAAMNAYARLLAKKCPDICINSVCPGHVKTDITCNTGLYTAEEGAAHPVRLALMPHGSPSGLFFSREEVMPF